MKPLLLLSLAILAGCAQTRTYTFTVEVTNQTNEPMVAGLVKDGPPLEVDWDSPEQIAIAAPQLMDKHWGRRIDPGTTTTFGPIDARFGGQTRGFMRIYSGDKTIEQLVSYSRSDPRRLHILLVPGYNFITVQERNGSLDAIVKP